MAYNREKSWSVKQLEVTGTTELSDKDLKELL